MFRHVLDRNWKGDYSTGERDEVSVTDRRLVISNGSRKDGDPKHERKVRIGSG